MKAWALLGAAWLALYVYVGARWVSGPHFEHVDGGPSDLPGWMDILFDVYLPAGVVAAAASLYWFVGRPWLRERRVTTEGLMLLAMVVLVFHEPFINYYSPVATYNAHLPNVGSWALDIPGWQSPGEPGQMMVMPVLFTVPMYMYGIFPVVLLCVGLMRRLRARFPRLGTFGLLVITVLFSALVTMLAELAWLRLGFFTISSAVPELTLFHGHYYQLPVYESVFVGLWCTAFAAILFFRNDRGETLVERGLEHVRAGSAGKVGLRFLAVLAAGSCIWMATYNLPYQFFNLKGYEWPRDTQQRSYFTNHICGPETDRACPARDLPLPREDSVRFDPNGRLVVPPGTPPPGAETVDRFAP